jgi:hypothetical protein
VHRFTRDTVENAAAGTGTSTVNARLSGAATAAYTFSDNILRDIGRVDVDLGVLNVESPDAISGASAVVSILRNRIENSPGRRGIHVLSDPSSGTSGTIAVTIDDNDVNDLPNRQGIYASTRETRPSPRSASPTTGSAPGPSAPLPAT